MKKYEKEVLQSHLRNEEAALQQLKTAYSSSLEDINGKIAELMARQDADMQHVIYQVEYQKVLKTQIEGVLQTLQAEQFTTISEYLTKSYEDGFVGVMYSLQKQGIPLCLPLDQKAMVRAVQLDSKISRGLYSRLGEDVEALKKKISAEVSRGISTGAGFRQVAQNIKAQMTGIYDKKSGGALYRAETIAVTEGHRIQLQSAMDACERAQESGADIVKQWDSTLDKRTRPSHRKVDGELRALDAPFSNGLMFPGDPKGGASEVIRCRCALLQRAKWELDEDELETLKERAAFFGLDKTESFEDYSKKYLNAAENAGKTASDSEKKVDISGESGIIEAGSDAMALENQRYGRNKNTLVNKAYIDSGEYRRKYDNATEYPEVNKTLYDCAKTALKHRSGTAFEDMYWIDGTTGRIVAKEIDGTLERAVKYSASTKKAVNAYEKKQLISLHTHPSSMPPSAADFNACFRHGYRQGYIACHDGKIFAYTADEEVNERLYNMYIESYIKAGQNEYDAQWSALSEMKRNCKIDFWEVN